MIGIGVDIGGTFVKLFVMNERGDVLRTHQFSTHYAPSADFFLKQIADFINEIKAFFPQERITVGVGAPGDVDSQKGLLRYNPNLPFTNIDNWPIADLLEQQTVLRPYVVNDASLAAWGVYELDLMRQGQHVLVVTLGTGVGGGLIVNGELDQGSNGSAGEVGHMRIDCTQDAPLCGCGNPGCLEAFVGTIGIKRRALLAAQREPRSLLAQKLSMQADFKVHLLAQAAQEGCPVALKLWQDTGYYLGVGLANCILLLDVDTVVLAGGISGAGEFFLPTIKEVFAAQKIQTPFKKLKLMISKNPNIGGAGAALYAIRQTLKNA